MSAKDPDIEEAMVSPTFATGGPDAAAGGRLDTLDDALDSIFKNILCGGGNALDRIANARAAASPATPGPYTRYAQLRRQHRELAERENPPPPKRSATPGAKRLIESVKRAAGGKKRSSDRLPPLVHATTTTRSVSAFAATLRGGEDPEADRRAAERLAEARRSKVLAVGGRHSGVPAMRKRLGLDKPNAVLPPSHVALAAGVTPEGQERARVEEAESQNRTRVQQVEADSMEVLRRQLFLSLSTAMDIDRDRRARRPASSVYNADTALGMPVLPPRGHDPTQTGNKSAASRALARLDGSGGLALFLLSAGPLLDEQLSSLRSAEIAARREIDAEYEAHFDEIVGFMRLTHRHAVQLREAAACAAARAAAVQSPKSIAAAEAAAARQRREEVAQRERDAVSRAEERARQRAVTMEFSVRQALTQALTAARRTVYHHEQRVDKMMALHQEKLDSLAHDRSRLFQEEGTLRDRLLGHERKFFDLLSNAEPEHRAATRGAEAARLQSDADARSQLEADASAGRAAIEDEHQVVAWKELLTAAAENHDCVAAIDARREVKRRRRVMRQRLEAAVQQQMHEEDDHVFAGLRWFFESAMVNPAVEEERRSWIFLLQDFAAGVAHVAANDRARLQQEVAEARARDVLWREFMSVFDFAPAPPGSVVEIGRAVEPRCAVLDKLFMVPVPRLPTISGSVSGLSSTQGGDSRVGHFSDQTAVPASAAELAEAVRRAAQRIMTVEAVGRQQLKMAATRRAQAIRDQWLIAQRAGVAMAASPAPGPGDDGTRQSTDSAMAVRNLLNSGTVTCCIGAGPVPLLPNGWLELKDGRPLPSATELKLRVSVSPLRNGDRVFFDTHDAAVLARLERGELRRADGSPIPPPEGIEEARRMMLQSSTGENSTSLHTTSVGFNRSAIGEASLNMSYSASMPPSGGARSRLPSLKLQSEPTFGGVLPAGAAGIAEESLTGFQVPDDIAEEMKLQEAAPGVWEKIYSGPVDALFRGLRFVSDAPPGVAATGTRVVIIELDDLVFKIHAQVRPPVLLLDPKARERWRPLVGGSWMPRDPVAEAAETSDLVTPLRAWSFVARPRCPKVRVNLELLLDAPGMRIDFALPPTLTKQGKKILGGGRPVATLIAATARRFEVEIEGNPSAATRAEVSSLFAGVTVARGDPEHGTELELRRAVQLHVTEIGKEVIPGAGATRLLLPIFAPPPSTHEPRLCAPPGPMVVRATLGREVPVDCGVHSGIGQSAFASTVGSLGALSIVAGGVANVDDATEGVSYPFSPSGRVALPSGRADVAGGFLRFELVGHDGRAALSLIPPQTVNDTFGIRVDGETVVAHDSRGANRVSAQIDGDGTSVLLIRLRANAPLSKAALDALLRSVAIIANRSSVFDGPLPVEMSLRATIDVASDGIDAARRGGSAAPPIDHTYPVTVLGPLLAPGGDKRRKTVAGAAASVAASATTAKGRESKDLNGSLQAKHGDGMSGARSPSAEEPEDDDGIRPAPTVAVNYTEGSGWRCLPAPADVTPALCRRLTHDACLRVTLTSGAERADELSVKGKEVDPKTGLFVFKHKGVPIAWWQPPAAHPPEADKSSTGGRHPHSTVGRSLYSTHSHSILSPPATRTTRLQSVTMSARSVSTQSMAHTPHGLNHPVGLSEGRPGALPPRRPPTQMVLYLTGEAAVRHGVRNFGSTPYRSAARTAKNAVPLAGLNALLRNLQFRNTSNDPTLAKTIVVSMDDGVAGVSKMTYDISVIAVDDPTEIVFSDPAPIYRQFTAATRPGFALLPMVCFIDPDSDNFHGGSLIVELSQAATDPNDNLVLLSPPQQALLVHASRLPPVPSDSDGSSDDAASFDDDTALPQFNVVNASEVISVSNGGTAPVSPRTAAKPISLLRHASGAPLLGPQEGSGGLNLAADGVTTTASRAASVFRRLSAMTTEAGSPSALISGLTPSPGRRVSIVDADPVSAQLSPRRDSTFAPQGTDFGDEEAEEPPEKTAAEIAAERPRISAGERMRSWLDVLLRSAPVSRCYPEGAPGMDTGAADISPNITQSPTAVLLCQSDEKSSSVPMSAISGVWAGSAEADVLCVQLLADCRTVDVLEVCGGRLRYAGEDVGFVTFRHGNPKEPLQCTAIRVDFANDARFVDFPVAEYVARCIGFENLSPRMKPGKRSVDVRLVCGQTPSAEKLTITCVPAPISVPPPPGIIPHAIGPAYANAVFAASVFKETGGAPTTSAGMVKFEESTRKPRLLWPAAGVVGLESLLVGQGFLEAVVLRAQEGDELAFESGVNLRSKDRSVYIGKEQVGIFGLPGAPPITDGAENASALAATPPPRKPFELRLDFVRITPDLLAQLLRSLSFAFRPSASASTPALNDSSPQAATATRRSSIFTPPVSNNRRASVAPFTATPQNLRAFSSGLSNPPTGSGPVSARRHSSRMGPVLPPPVAPGAAQEMPARPELLQPGLLEPEALPASLGGLVDGSGAVAYAPAAPVMMPFDRVVEVRVATVTGAAPAAVRIPVDVITASPPLQLALPTTYHRHLVGTAPTPLFTHLSTIFPPGSLRCTLGAGTVVNVTINDAPTLAPTEFLTIVPKNGAAAVFTLEPAQDTSSLVGISPASPPLPPVLAGAQLPRRGGGAANGSPFASELTFAVDSRQPSGCGAEPRSLPPLRHILRNGEAVAVIEGWRGATVNAAAVPAAKAGVIGTVPASVPRVRSSSLAAGGPDSLSMSLDGQSLTSPRARAAGTSLLPLLGRQVKLRLVQELPPSAFATLLSAICYACPAREIRVPRFRSVDLELFEGGVEPPAPGIPVAAGKVTVAVDVIPPAVDLGSIPAQLFGNCAGELAVCAGAKFMPQRTVAGYSATVEMDGEDGWESGDAVGVLLGPEPNVGVGEESGPTGAAITLTLDGAKLYATSVGERGARKVLVASVATRQREVKESELLQPPVAPAVSGLHSRRGSVAPGGLPLRRSSSVAQETQTGGADGGGDAAPATVSQTFAVSVNFDVATPAPLRFVEYVMRRLGVAIQKPYTSETPAESPLPQALVTGGRLGKPPPGRSPHALPTRLPVGSPAVALRAGRASITNAAATRPEGAPSLPARGAGVVSHAYVRVTVSTPLGTGERVIRCLIDRSPPVPKNQRAS